MEQSCPSKSILNIFIVRRHTSKMANMLIIFILFHTAASLTGPVLIIDSRAVLKPSYHAAPNPFYEMSSSEFKDVIGDILQMSDSILIFVEDNLSIEDLSRRDAKGSPYQYLRQSLLEEKAKYMPSVVDPLKTLQEVLVPLDDHVAKISDSVNFCDLKAKYHYVHFEEPKGDTASRAEILRRHDLLINKTHQELAGSRTGPIVIVYTGRSNPMMNLGVSGYQRARERSREDVVMRFSDQALIRLSGVTLQQGSQLSELVPVKRQALRFTRSRIAARIDLGRQLDLVYNFEIAANAWSAESVVLLEDGEEVGRTFMGIGAPLDCSYFCAEPMEVVNTRDNSIVHIAKYQLQPLKDVTVLRDTQLRDDNTTNTTAAATSKQAPTTSTADFDKTVTCGVHFTSQILAGTFVAAIVLSIAMTGIVMMSDCRSNQRMDDANQPPLVIAQLL